MKEIKTKSNNKKIITGSKVSVSVLIDYIKDGYSIAEFLADYPWIKRGSVQKALNEIKKKDYPYIHAF